MNDDRKTHIRKQIEKNVCAQRSKQVAKELRAHIFVCSYMFFFLLTFTNYMEYFIIN